MRLLNTAALRTLVIYAVILPLAIFLGWMAVDLANWNQTSFAVFASVIFVLLLPVLLKWHYAAMVFSWHTFIAIFFLPGSPALWMLLAAVTFGIAIVNRILQKDSGFLHAPSITIPLVGLLMVLLITGYLRGGFGSHALGSTTYGGKSYYLIIAAILGYFAFISRQIPGRNAKLYVTLFFLPGAVGAISNLIYLAGPAFYFLYLVFPSSFAGVQAMSEYSSAGVRLAGFTSFAIFVAFYLLAVNGIRGLLRKWWLLAILLVSFALGALGGYRGLFLLIGLLFVILFISEGLIRTPVFPALLLVLGLSFAFLVPFSSKLPRSVQRTLSFLPIQIDPIVRSDAEASTNWRLEMWNRLIPDLPKYIWLGKGFALDPLDLYLANEAVRRGRVESYQGSLAAGDYHSGPLSTFVPLGLFGSLAFFAFLCTSLRALYLNYKYGAEELKTINRFMFAYFVTRSVFFLVAFGALSSDLFYFTGTIGLSIALNKGICRKPRFAPQPVRFQSNLRLGGAQPRPV